MNSIAIVTFISPLLILRFQKRRFLPRHFCFTSRKTFTMPKLFLGVHEISLANSNAKCLLDNWVEERAVEKLDEDKKGSGQAYIKKRAVEAHKGILASACDPSLDDLTASLDAYRPPESYIKPAIKTKAAALEKVFREQAIKEMREKEETERWKVEKELAEMRQGNIVIRNKDVCPVAETFMPEYVKEQPVTFWSKHAKNPLGVTKAGEISFRRDASFSTPIHSSFLTSAHSHSVYM